MKLIRDHDNVTKWDRRQECMKYLESPGRFRPGTRQAAGEAEEGPVSTWGESWDALHGGFQ